LTKEGYRVRAFESAEEYLDKETSDHPGCVLMDVCLPGRSGTELQRAINSLPCPRPIVFLTDASDVQTGVNAMKAGAVDFLMKPIEPRKLCAAIEQAMRCDSEQRLRYAVRAIAQQRFDALTPREQQVMKQVVRGKLNKQIAAELGTVEKTVKVHRARVMSKMMARSLPELVLLGTLVGVSIEPVQGVRTASIDWRQAAVRAAPAAAMMA
jgi:FixJ family two-component response regulator